MHNLVIIGNGFDLAHGLKTSYTDFVRSIVNTRSENSEAYSNLFKSHHLMNHMPEYEAFIKFQYQNYNAFRHCFTNPFFLRIFENPLKHWCDIERLYFNELNKNVSNYSEYSEEDPAKILNDFFEDIKKHLEEYLTNQQSHFKPLISYSNFFSSICESRDSLILNFNYTNTVNNYLEGREYKNLIHIHGELNSIQNPIIFGFAANDSESRTLINKDHKEYMRNIKKHNYKKTNNENRLRNYLKGTDKIDVLILGHSCGISDKLILNQILNHDKINSIRTFYYEDYESYFETQVNIDRIMNNDDNFEKLEDYSSCHRMPQFSDSKDQNLAFDNYISDLIKSQETRRVSYYAARNLKMQN